VLYDDIVDQAASQPSKETSGPFLLMAKTFPLAFLELMTAGKRILWHLQSLFCVFQRSLPPCYSRSMKQYMCMLKIVTGLLWECFQILIFCVVVTHSFPFHSFHSDIIIRSDFRSTSILMHDRSKI